jgi:AGCS family alanine or glycine:cation symporter
MDINLLIKELNGLLWGWPFLIFIIATSVILTVMLNFVQFRYFFRAWKYVFKPAAGEAKADLTPLQAFLNAINASIGNGSLAGMATAIFAGGPGAALWVFVIGLLGMALRFAEVFLATTYTDSSGKSVLGGPMLYLSKAPGGKVLPYLYATFCLFLAIASGNMMQANSVRIAIVNISGAEPWIVAIFLLLFIGYVVAGGAPRIIKVSDKIVPVKIGVFLLSAIIMIIYHYAAIIPALKLICVSAFDPQAALGAAAGYGVQEAIRFGTSRSINSSEAGLGTASIFFGSTGSKNPVQSGIMSILGSFITANIVCFSLMLIIVASGVWNNGQTSIDLTIAAYKTVFGSLGGWIVTFLSISFGIGTMVAYAYLARACWLFLTGGKMLTLFNLFYVATAGLGAVAAVEIVWNLTDVVNFGLLFTNLFGMLCLAPVIRKAVVAFQAADKK